MMERRVYVLMTGLSLALGAALLATPLWDFWYYRALRSSPGSYVPVAVVVAAPAPAGPNRPMFQTTGWSAAVPEASPRAEGPSPRPVPEPDPVRVMSAPLWAERPARRQEQERTARERGSIDSPSASPVESDTVDSPAGQVTPTEAPGVAMWYPPQPETEPADAALRQQPQDDSPGGSAPSSRIAPSPTRSGDEDPTPPPLPAVRLVPDRFDLLPGEAVVITVQVSDAVSMSSLPFHLRFDPAVLEFLDSQEGAALSGTHDPILLASVSPNRPGDLAVGLSLVESSGLFTGSGALVQLRFRAIAPGESDLEFDRASLRGPTSRPVEARFEKTHLKVE